MKFASAAVLIPSQAFLEGQVDVTLNPRKIVQLLTDSGLEVKKVTVLEEDVHQLAGELQTFTQLYDIVIVVLNGDTQCASQALANITSQEVSRFTDQLWPKAVKLLRAEAVPPVIYLQRIFIVTAAAIDDQLNLILKRHIQQYSKEPLYSKQFQVIVNGNRKHIEALSTDLLSVSFGSPTNADNEGCTSITLKAKDFESVVKGEIYLRNLLGQNMLASKLLDDGTDLIYQSEDEHIRQSILVVERCLEDYGIDNVFLSFNGGKDCTVLLHLVHTVLCRKYPNVKDQKKLFCLYVRSENTFHEQDEFIEQCLIYYNLEIMSVTANIKDALRITISKKPHLKACFMGTRRTDPFCSHLNAFQMTDSDWPEIMRCSPFLDWHYSDIWDYLLYYKVPYCKLYDYGFTSLGNTTNTIRNPSLICAESDKDIYLPAYKMLREKNERSGRNVSKM
ncbi:FAD synthase [Dendroctonus ponderosae]|nr:FAD synthase [Dendroctonus ponderosae]KAH1010842.1 hypothetical protein HUJ05_005085 [Dendroctonus ponderosae]